MNLRVLITGSSGMVGEGVLLRCLQDPRVEKVLVINRRTCGHQHPKLKEILLDDFFKLEAIEDQLSGLQACFFCLGVSSVGLSKEQYEKITYALTLNFAKTLIRLNPGMSFMYVSGAGTDSSEKGRLHWARVKGKTENDLKKLSFAHVYAYRPGFIKPLPGQKHAYKAYRYLGWLYPIGRAISVNIFISLQEIGDSMINLAANPTADFILNGRRIAETAKV